MTFNFQTTHTVTGHTSGNNVDINFTFDYLDEDDVKVYKTDTSGTALEIGTNWQFQNKKRIRILNGTANVGTIANNDVFIIQRQTNVTDAYITYAPGSAVRAEDLNNNQKQALFSAQEREERGIPSTGGTLTGDLIVDDSSIIFEEGSHRSTISAPDLADNRTITIPDQSGTIPLLAVDSDTAITSTPEELNILDGVTATASELNIMDGVTATTAELNFVDGVTSNVQTQLNAKQPLDTELTELATMASTTAAALADLTEAEVQILDGATLSTAELNLLDGVTATTAELNTMDGITASTAELNLMDGVTATTAELNLLDGVTASTTEINLIDGVTATTAELNILDGVTSTAAELNILDGVTSTAAELNILDGVTTTAAELNTLDGVNSTLSASDLNQLDSNTLTTSATWTSNVQFPSAKNIDDRITARIDPIGGYEAIADEDSFPTTAPPEGTIVSIANAGGMVIGASSSTTDATRLGGSDAVTINNIPATLQSQTVQDGLGMLVVKDSGTGHTYDFHRVVATDQDVIGLSQQMDDFAARYRVGNTNPTTGLCGLDGTGTGSRPCDGDMFFNTGTGKMLVYDGDTGTADNDAAVQARWEEVQSIGNFKIIPATELADFADGSASVETITDAPTSAEQIILSINGVVQEPQAGTSAPSDGFALDGDIIRLSATPPNPSEVWGVIIGSAVNIGTPSNNTVDTAQLVDDGVTNDKLESANGSEAVDTNVIRDDAVTDDKLADSTDTDANRAVGTNHIKDGNVTRAKIANEAIDEARLQVSNTPTNGQFLSAQSGNTGGLTWATVSTATPTLQQVLDSGNQSTTDISFNDANGSAIAFDASQGSAVFNDQGQADGDFRVESDSNTHMLFVDAGNNRVGINNSTPTAPLDVTGDIHVRDASGVQHFIQPAGNTIFNDRGLNVDFRVESDNNANMLFVDGGEDRVGIGTATPEYTLDVTGTDAVALPAGTDAQRPGSLDANDEGLLRYSTTSGQFEYWATTDDTPQWRLVGDAPQRTIAVQYLVIAGGGSGGAGLAGGAGGGGGAGGYRTNFGSGNISGRLSAVEAAMNVSTGSALSLSVGAGGTAMTGNTNSTDIPAGSDGSDSTFNTITSTGGGAGGRNDGGHGNDGGCGGGSGGRLGSANPGSGTAGQGFDGGDCTVDNDLGAGGGGGAGAAGDADQTTTGTSNRTASGGAGLASSITGSSVTRAGGGGAAGNGSGCTMTTMGGLGGSGGGGNGASTNSANGTAGTANTGGGGGGNLRNCSSSNAGAGGSGVILLRTAAGVTARFTAGVVVNGTSVSTDDTAVAGSAISGSTDLLWTVTAAASDTVTFS